MSDSVDQLPSCEWAPARRLLWCVLCPLILAIFLPSFLSCLTPAEGRVYDFFKEWAAVQNWRTELPLYTKQEDALRKHLGLSVVRSEGFLDRYNTHPPTASLVVMPVAWLPYREAHFAWNVATLALFGLGLYWVARALQPSIRTYMVLPLISLLVVCDPLRQSLIQGQPNLLLAFLIIATWRADRHGHSILAGATLALSAAIKLYPAFVFIYFVMRKDWRAVFGGAAAFVLIAVATAAVFGVDAYLDYVQVVLPQMKAVTNNWGNASVLAFWERLFGPSTPSSHSAMESPELLLAAVVISMSLIVGAVGFFCIRARTRGQRDAAFIMAVTSMLLLSPMTWHHSFVIAALPLGIVIAGGKVGSLERFVVIVLLLALSVSPRIVWMKMIDPLPGYEAAGGPAWENGSMVAMPWQSLTALSYQFYALVMLVILSARLFGKDALVRDE